MVDKLIYMMTDNTLFFFFFFAGVNGRGTKAVVYVVDIMAAAAIQATMLKV